NLYVADGQAGRVRFIDRETGVIRAFAGDGSDIPSGDDGPASAAGLGKSDNMSVAVDENGQVTIGIFDLVRRVDLTRTIRALVQLPPVSGQPPQVHSISARGDSIAVAAFTSNARVLSDVDVIEGGVVRNVDNDTFGAVHWLDDGDLL